MGNLDVVPVLGYDLPRYFPTLLIVVVLFNLLNIYGKIMRALGFRVFNYSENSDDSNIKEGKDIVERMKKDILIKLEDEHRGQFEPKSEFLRTIPRERESRVTITDSEFKTVEESDDDYRLFDSLVTRKKNDWE